MKNKQTVITLRMTSKMHEDVKKIAEYEETTSSTILRQAIKHYINKKQRTSCNENIFCNV